MKAATLTLSAAGLTLTMALLTGCSKGVDPNGPGNKTQATKQKPSVEAAGPGSGAGTAGRPGQSGSAGAGVKE